MFLNKAERDLILSYNICNNKKNEEKIKKILKLFRPQLNEEQKKIEEKKINTKNNKI